MAAAQCAQPLPVWGPLIPCLHLRAQTGLQDPPEPVHAVPGWEGTLRDLVTAVQLQPHTLAQAHGCRCQVLANTSLGAWRVSVPPDPSLWELGPPMELRWAPGTQTAVMCPLGASSALQQGGDIRQGWSLGRQVPEAPCRARGKPAGCSLQRGGGSQPAPNPPPCAHVCASAAWTLPAC